MSKNDGGAAFPGGVNECYSNKDKGEPTQYGMTLRDYFAAKALQGLLSGEFNPASSYEEDAAMAYKYADAMIQARGEL